MENLKFDTNRKKVKYCPCGKSNDDGKFCAYKGYDDKGYCHSCGNTFLPKNEDDSWKFEKPIPVKKTIDTIPSELFTKQFEGGKHLYDSNNFILFLSNIRRGELAFSTDTVNDLIGKYRLLNSRKLSGWTLFPYIDINGKIRDIKAIDYNPNTGKRISTKNGDSKNRCYFIGKKMLQNDDANLERCFYGEHLLHGNNKLVRVFESEATATYSAPFFPNDVCIATGGKNGCKWTEKSKCSVLQGRTVILYPDIDAHDEWIEKSEILKGYGLKVSVSNTILTAAKAIGLPIEDLKAMKFDLRDILQFKVVGTQNIFTYQDGSTIELTKEGYPKEWDEPAERNATNDYWRAIILFENLESAVLAKDHYKVNKAIDSIFLLYDEDADLPINLMQQYAPTALQYLN